MLSAKLALLFRRNKLLRKSKSLHNVIKMLKMKQIFLFLHRFVINFSEESDYFLVQKFGDFDESYVDVAIFQRSWSRIFANERRNCLKIDRKKQCHVRSHCRQCRGPFRGGPGRRGARPGAAKKASSSQPGLSTSTLVIGFCMFFLLKNTPRAGARPRKISGKHEPPLRRSYQKCSVKRALRFPTWAQSSTRSQTTRSGSQSSTTSAHGVVFLLFEKLSGVRKLTTLYLAKNDHRWATFISLKTINSGASGALGLVMTDALSSSVFFVGVVL